MPRPLEHVNFAKIIIVCASAFGIAVGACGLTAVGAGAMHTNGSLAVALGLIEIGVMLLSAIGLVVTVIAWIVVSIIYGGTSMGSEPQRLFDKSSDKDKDS